ncbi:MAG: nuclear transport factor 2 family protein [Sphingobium sp.]|nr:nuclear transport factor 2 family protein [Sphingobium sp.]
MPTKGIRAALALGATALIASGAQAKTTKETMLDRLQIEDLVIEYYSQLGGTKGPDFGNEYTEDGVLVLGTREIKGREAIKAMYAGLRPADPSKPRVRMNVLVNNPRITVTGNTAHGEFIYTGVQVPDPAKAPEVHEQGREIDEFVKVGGEWKIKRRQIINDANAGFGAPPPAVAPKPAG